MRVDFDKLCTSISVARDGQIDLGEARHIKDGRTDGKAVLRVSGQELGIVMFYQFPVLWIARCEL